MSTDSRRARSDHPTSTSAGWREHLREQWHLFADDEPGRRFVNLYERRRQHRHGAFSWGRVLVVGAGLLLMVVGVFFLAVPGPGLPVLVAGLGLMSSESLIMARLLDWAERTLRPTAMRLKKRWDALKPRTRTLYYAVAVVAGLAMLTAFVVWRH